MEQLYDKQGREFRQCLEAYERIASGLPNGEEVKAFDVKFVKHNNDFTLADEEGYVK